LAPCAARFNVLRRPHGRRERNATIGNEVNFMDLVTLVAACALTVDPKTMHALIWHQSGGEPWSFTMPGERQPRVYHTVRDAIGAVRAMERDSAIRVGLTGISTDRRSVTIAMFAPCPNITLAARQIVQLGERCKTSQRFKGDPIYCAIAAYHGAWDRPDNAFADAVRTSVAKNDAPNFEMPADTGFDFSDGGTATQPALHDTAAAPPPPIAPDDWQRGWSSALFPVKSHQFDIPSADGSATDPRAADAQKSDAPNVRPPTAALHVDGLFVPRSPERRPR
jgi:hypothetical protein